MNVKDRIKFFEYLKTVKAGDTVFYRWPFSTQVRTAAVTRVTPAQICVQASDGLAPLGPRRFWKRDGFAVGQTAYMVPGNQE